MSTAAVRWRRLAVASSRSSFSPDIWTNRRLFGVPLFMMCLVVDQLARDLATDQPGQAAYGVLGWGQGRVG